MERILISILSVALLLTACQKNEFSTPPAEDPVLCATVEEVTSTRTIMDVNNNIRWSEGDQVVAFMKTSLGLKYQIKKEYTGKTYGYFSQVSSGSSSDLGAGIEWDHNVVYYPYSGDIEAEKSGSNYFLSVVLPTEQTYVAESFGNGSMAMVAVGETNNITFMNILGGMKLQLKGTQKVKSIKLQGNNNEKLSGTATVTAYTDATKPTITMTSGALTSVTLDCGEGVQLNEELATDFVISLPPTTFADGFVVTILDSTGATYELNTGKLNEVKRSSLLVMPPIDIRENVVSTRMLKLVSVDYNSYQIELTVPETVGPEGNIIRYNYCCEAIFNQNLNEGWNYDLMLQYNGGVRNTADVSKVITIEVTENDEGGYLIEPIAPGEPIVFLAGEYTREGQLVGEPEVIRFKTKEPAQLNADIEVEVSDVSAVDAEFCIIPDAGINLYCMLVLDDETFNYLLNDIVSEADLQWFVSSYYAMYQYGAYTYEGASDFNLNSFFINPPLADTKYHILITGMGNKEGTIQCFKHFEFKTEKKKRSYGPSMTVTHLPEKSTESHFVYNIKCTSVDDVNAGLAIGGSYACAEVSAWEEMLNMGYTYESILSSGYSFSPEEINRINSVEGCELTFDFSATETVRLAVLCYNDEFTSSDVIIVDVNVGDDH